jgi:hypothetical protein
MMSQPTEGSFSAVAPFVLLLRRQANCAWMMIEAGISISRSAFIALALGDYSLAKGRGADDDLRPKTKELRGITHGFENW